MAIEIAATQTKSACADWVISISSEQDAQCSEQDAQCSEQDAQCSEQDAQCSEQDAKPAAWLRLTHYYGKDFAILDIRV